MTHRRIEKLCPVILEEHTEHVCILSSERVRSFLQQTVLCLVSRRLRTLTPRANKEYRDVPFVAVHCTDNLGRL